VGNVHRWTERHRRRSRQWRPNLFAWPLWLDPP
jgi:hypothetical protein